MSETPQQWAKRMKELTDQTPQFCLHAFIDRYREREKDYGVLKCYGPFTEEELDEFDIAHAVHMHDAAENWIFSFDNHSTHEQIMASFERFIEERRPEEYEQYRKDKV